MAKAAKESLRFNSWTLGGQGADLFEKSAEALELERLNPLRGVDEWRLGQIFDDARDGVYADLAWLYNEIEGVEPALLTCCDARESAASECGWLVRTADADRVRGFDQTLADEQRDALLAEYGAVEDDLAELAGHLVSAFFRGAAHARPLWNADGSLAGFQHLDLWNFALDRKTGLWYWNADASRDEGSFQAIPPGELVTLCATRHVDHAALPIFIRAALGAKRYGVWLDRFGIPPVGVIMPPNAEKGEQAAYMDLARKFARGGSGILPNASQIVYGTEARAVCPFTDFIRFQQQQIYTVGLGRVQSGDNAGENLGGNAAGVVDGAFRRIVRRDARRIARAINDGVTARILARLFPGRPALAQFAWDTDERRTGREVLEDARIARNAGLAIDLDQLRELTGYQLEKAPETPSPSLFPGLNSATPLQTALQGVAKREEGSGRTTTPESGDAPQRAILAAFAKDTSKASEAVKALLAEEDPEKLKALSSKLIADLPTLIPDDPALAAVIAEAMAAEFSPDGRARTPSAPDMDGRARTPAAPPRNTVATNKQDANGMEHGEAGSGKGCQFVSKDGGSSGAASEKTQKEEESLDEKVKAVTPARIAEITSGRTKGLISVEEGLAVVNSDPAIKDRAGRTLRFDSTFVGKYRYGIGRSMNKPDEERFRRVQDAIYAVVNDENPIVVFKKKRIQSAEPPRGSQRMYRTPTANGETWAISWADKVYIRSIQERPKNKPPYEK